MTRASPWCALLSAILAVAGGCSMRLNGLGGDQPAAPAAEAPPGVAGQGPPIGGGWPFFSLDGASAIGGDQGADAGAGADATAAEDLAAPGDLASAPEGDAPPEVTLALGMVLYLRFDTDPSRSPVGDDSPLHQVAVPHQLDTTAAVVDGWMGQALAFPGSGYLSVDGWALNKIGRALSISCWYRSPGTAAPPGTLLARRWSTVNGFLYRLDIADGQLQLAINSGYSYHARLTSRTSVPAQGWVHLAATFDGLTASLYIDGKPSGSAGYKMSIPDERTPLLVGAAATSGGISSPLTGQLDEVILYDRALTPAEVEALASGARPLR